MANVFNADEIFAIGVEIEKNGRRFYLLTADKTDDEDLEKILKSLAEWESHHIELFDKLRRDLPAEAKQENIYDPDNQIHLYLKATADNHIFVKNSSMEALVEKCSTPTEILLVALQFEKDSVVFYSSMKNAVRDDLGKPQIDKLITEELNHIARVNHQLEKYKK